MKLYSKCPKVLIKSIHTCVIIMKGSNIEKLFALDLYTYIHTCTHNYIYKLICTRAATDICIILLSICWSFNIYPWPLYSYIMHDDIIYIKGAGMPVGVSPSIPGTGCPTLLLLWQNVQKYLYHKLHPIYKFIPWETL